MKIPGVLLVCALALPVLADEGMWLCNEFPKDAVKKAYGFEVTDAFLENLRLATLRIGGSSGSFVSAGGVVLTHPWAAPQPTLPPQNTWPEILGNYSL